MPGPAENLPNERRESSIPTVLADLLDSNGGVKQDYARGEVPKGLSVILDNPQNVTDVPEVKLEIKKAMVAFLDVLGTSHLMQTVQADNAARIYGQINGMAETFQDGFNALNKVYQESMSMIISDSFVIAVPYDPDALKALVSFLADFQYKCLTSFSQLLRGAISVGEIVGDTPSNMIIGPAFIEAHVIEEQIAIFPRIVVDREIINDNNLYSTMLPIVSDKDGFQYIDFVESREMDMAVRITQSEYNKAIEDRKQKHIQKWNWLLTFLDQKAKGCLNCCQINPVGGTLTA
jgi:hypothetical protein